MKDIPTEEAVRAAVVAVFEMAARVAGPAILGALVPHTAKPIPAIHLVPEYQAQELYRFVNQLKEYLRATSDAPAATRLRVLVYCQVMQALPPAIVWSLLRLIVGEEP